VSAATPPRCGEGRGTPGLLNAGSFQVKHRRPDIPAVIDLTDAAPPPVFAAVADPERVATVQQTGLAHGGADSTFDRIARLASALVGTPISFVTLVTGDRQLAPGAVRHDRPDPAPRSQPLSASFCSFAVATGEPLVIEDTSRSELVRSSSAPRAHGVSAYAGIPLRSQEGHVLGTLCVLDRIPRCWSERELALLDDLAELATHELDLRITSARMRQQQQKAHGLVEAVTAVGDVLPVLVERAERTDDVQLQRYAALTRRRTERLQVAARELEDTVAAPAPPAVRTTGPIDVRTALNRAVASARAATGSALLEVDLPDVAVPRECDALELERALAHLLVTVLSHSDAMTPVQLRLTPPVSRTVQLIVEAPGAQVPTAELNRVAARFGGATCPAPDQQSTAPAGRVQVSKRGVTVRSGAVEAVSSPGGTTFTARWVGRAETRARTAEIDPTPSVRS
jgi:signal transduction histidine kinase